MYIYETKNVLNFGSLASTRLVKRLSQQIVKALTFNDAKLFMDAALMA